MGKEYIIGIDEVGRGPLAGPVMVGAVLVPKAFVWGRLPGVTDSKQLTAKRREEIYKLAKSLSRAGELDFVVARTSAAQIDKMGIAAAIKLALERTLATLEHRHQYQGGDVLVKLDGGLKAPARYLKQETIIKGDQKEKVIGLASIMAKVTRDNYMEKIGNRAEFAGYGFFQHKGYGTKKHLVAIKSQGLSKEHRVSFCHF